MRSISPVTVPSGGVGGPLGFLAPLIGALNPPASLRRDPFLGCVTVRSGGVGGSPEILSPSKSSALNKLNPLTPMPVPPRTPPRPEGRVPRRGAPEVS